MRRKQLLDGPRREVDAALGQHRVDRAAGPVELGTARSVFACARAADAFFLLLVALLARLLVLLDQLQQVGGERIQVEVAECPLG